MLRWNNLWALGVLALVLSAGCADSVTKSVEPEFSLLGVLPDGNSDSKFKMEFKEVAVGQEVTKGFTIRNTGDGPLTVTEIEEDLTPFQTSLDCEGTCEERTIAPGGSLNVRVDFRPVSDQPITKQFTIRSNAKQKKFTFTVTGRGAKANFVCNPPTSLDFGNLVRGTSATKKISCKNDSPLDAVLQILGVSTDAYTVSVAAADGKILVQGGRTIEVPITFRAQTLGDNYATLNMQIEGGVHLPPILLSARVLQGALEVDPTPELVDDEHFGPYDFGFVKPGTSAEIKITLRNLGNEPLEIQDLSLDSTSSTDFTLSPPSPFRIGGLDPLVPGANEVLATLRFAPTGIGPRLGQINLVSSDPANPVRTFQVIGFGGGPTLDCAPLKISFGATAVGVPRSREIICTNIAEFDDPDTENDRLRIFNPFMEAPVSDFSVRVKDGIKRDGYGVGDSFVLVVDYTPVDNGLDVDKVILKTNDTAYPFGFLINVDGDGRNYEDCVFDVLPGAGVRYGNVAPRKSMTLEVGIRNLKDTRCLIQDVRIRKGSDLSFRLGYPEGKTIVDFIELEPSGEVRIPVTFNPAYKTSHVDGILEFQVNVGAGLNPTQEVDLSGASADPCILTAPSNADFGVVAPGCATRARLFQAINVCTLPIDVSSVTIADGPTDEFKISRGPSGVVALKKGESVEFEITYRPEAEGEDTAAVFVQTAQSTEPFSSTVHGEADLEATQSDLFDQDLEPKVDILWVVSNGYGMGTETQNLQKYADIFLNAAVDNAVNFHLGVTTTGAQYDSWSCGMGVGIMGREEGRLVPVFGERPRILTRDTPDLLKVFKKNLDVGACQYYENGSFNAYQAVTDPMASSLDDPRYPAKNDGNLGFLRGDASLAIIFFSDNTDMSPDTPKFYYNAILATKGFDRARVGIHGFISSKNDAGANICGAAAYGIGTKYKEMIRLAGGVEERVCPDDWPQAMRNVANASFGFKSCFPLTNQPEDSDGDGVITDKGSPPELEVRLNGRGFPATGARGNRQWEYDEAQNSVCFFPLSMPEPGSQVGMSYGVACLE